MLGGTIVAAWPTGRGSKKAQPAPTTNAAAGK